MPDISPYITEYILSRKKDPPNAFQWAGYGIPLKSKVFGHVGGSGTPFNPWFWVDTSLLPNQLTIDSFIFA